MNFNFSFFGNQEHRVFNYKPRYYDPEKEALKDMFGHVDGTKKAEYTPGSYLQGSFRGGNYQKTRGQSKAQAIIGAVALLLFFVVMVLITKFYGMIEW